MKSSYTLLTALLGISLTVAAQEPQEQVEQTVQTVSTALDTAASGAVATVEKIEGEEMIKVEEKAGTVAHAVINDLVAAIETAEAEASAVAEPVSEPVAAPEDLEETMVPATPSTPAYVAPKAPIQTRTEEDQTYKWDISTNIFDWADFATINVDAAYTLSRHWSIQAGLKFNPWKFEPNKGAIKLVENKQIGVSFGGRYWPWYVYSGLWFCGKIQYCSFEETGVWRPAFDTGKALGAGLSMGYTIMLNERFNLEIGGGFWGGALLQHELYNCPDKCYDLGDLRESGPKGFIALNDLNISVHYLF